MHPNKSISGRRGLRARRAIAALMGLAVAGATGAGTAQAQELTHRFINPSFGGNPFYSEHLLGIANIHRPKEPEAPPTPTPTEEDILVEGIRGFFSSQASSTIRENIQNAIRNARPGDTGNFELGDSRISFTRTQTETRITFLNTRTGESRVVVVPVTPSSGTSAAALGTGTTLGTSPALSPEQALGATGTQPSGPLSGGLSSALFPSPLLGPGL